MRPPNTSVVPNQPSRASVLQAVRSLRLHKRPRLLLLGSLWLLGLFAMFLAPPPHAITEEALNRYEEKLNEAIDYAKANQDAAQAWDNALHELRQARTWFWFWSPERRREVRKAKAAERAAHKVARRHDRHVERLVSKAKAELGLWSEAGVQEGRRLFWNSFESGKIFARRQTIWDTALRLLSSSSSSDSSLLGTLINVICIAVVNFTAGMLSSILIFMWQLPGLLLSYQASWLSMATFYAVAMCGAVSVILSYLAAIYAAGAAAIYTSATLMSPYRRLEGHSGAARPVYIAHHEHAS